MNRSTAHKSVNRSRLLQPGYLSGKSQPKSTSVRKTASVNNEGKKVFSRKQAVTSGTKSFESRAAFSNMTNSPEVNEAVVRTKNKSPSAISRTKLNNKTISENENNFKPQESFTLKTPRYVNSFDKENEKKSASPALKSKPVGLKKSILQSKSDLKENTLEVQPRVRRLDFSQGSNSKVSENFEFGNISKKENLNFNADQNDIEFEADPNSLNCIMNEGGVTQKMLMDLRVPNQTKDGRASEVINNMRVFADGRPSGCMRVPINRPSTAGPRRVRNTGDGRISNASRPPIRSSSAYKAAAVRSSLYTSSRKNSLAPSSTRPTQARASLYTSSKAVVRTSTYASSTRNAASVQARKPLISSNPRKPEVTRNAYVPSKKFQNVKIERNVSVAQSSKKAVKWADERNDAAEEDLIEDSPNLKHSPISSRIVIATPRSILKDKSKRKAKQVIPMKTTKPPTADESDEEIEIVTPVVLNEEEPSSSSGVDVADSGENTEEKPITNHVSPNIKIERVLMELKRGMTSAKRRSLQTEYETVIQLIQRAAPAVMETLHENVEREDEEKKEVDEEVEKVQQVADVKNKSKFEEEDEKERRNAEMLEDQIKNLKLEVEEIQSCRKERELQRSMMGFPTMTPLKSNYYSQQQQSSNHKLSTNCYASLNKPPTTAAASQSNYSAQKLHFSHQQGVNTSGSSQNSTPSKLQAVTKQQVPNKAAAADVNLSFFKPLPQQERVPRFFTPIKYALNSNSSDDDLSSKGTTWGDQLSQYKTVTTTTKQSAMPGAPSLNRVDAIISQQQEEKYTSSSTSAPTDVEEALSSSFRNHNKLSPPRCSSNKVYDDRSYTELAESSPLMKFHPASQTSSAVDSNLIFPAAQRFTVHTPHALRVYRQRLQEVRHSPYRRISRKYDEVLADEEVALYCSRMNSAAPLSPRTDFVDPVAHCLRFGDDDHFIPVSATPSPAAPTRFVSRSGKSSAFK